ncbi:hypothetical protein CY34DRAFT_431025 [Suillus luteus UH-Slu-Lm8-n1]|uniref:Uncharacterized protein n=1 Tax=Suillus luteus UH-Slu-Lm8-n1 TaxID=930992 RepID=A0A0D0BU18_9AGAM|nr:hypothetical protein CY34DRAFT_431025 [Suillus luteus UH-Slu-Lm8-n1]
MVNWQDPEVIESWNAVFVDITLVILGLYGWSYIHSCQVESALLRLFAVMNIVTPPDMDCYNALKFLVFSGNIVVACTSTNLVIRTWTIWKTNWFVQTQILLSPPSFESCGYMIVNPTYSAATSMYTMIFDFVLLKITIFGYWRSSSSSLFTIIRTQGVIVYFIVFFASIIPSIFSWLNFNYIVNVFFVWPATCIMIIASGYAVIPTFNTPQSTSHRTPVRGPIVTEAKSNVRITTCVVLSE